MPESTVDIALSLKDAKWFPIEQMRMAYSPERDDQFKERILSNLDTIAWAAAVALLDNGWDASEIGIDWAKDFQWVSAGRCCTDPDPIRATLLAAREMERSRHE